MKARVGAVLTVALLATIVSASPAGASPARPTNLYVAGGEESWHPENRFELEWDNPSSGAEPPLAAVHYRIRSPLGAAIEEGRIGWVTAGIAGLTVPKAPGIYTAEVWLEDSTGAEGLAAAAQLRFDDRRPGQIEPSPVPYWIGRTAFPLTVHLGHPPGPVPISGIRGYAVAIDGTSGRAPCAAADRCEENEVSLRGGIDDDSLAIAALPEGMSYLHAVAVSGSGMKSVTSGQTTLRVDTTDPTTLLAGAPNGWVNHSVDLAAKAIDAGSGMGQDGHGPPPMTAIRVDGGVATSVPGDTATTTVIEEGVHRVAYYARDAAGNTDDGGSSNGFLNRPPQAALVRIDRGAPSVAFANSQDPGDPDLILVRVADSLSGPDPSRGWIGVRRAGSGDRFEPLSPVASAAGELRARWDSDAYPNGEYEFQAIGYDGAGNTAATTKRGNGEAMVLSNPLKAGTSLRADFGGNAPSRVVPFGRSVALSGRLTVGRSTALEGLPVRIVERFAPSSNPAVRISTAWTGPTGAFSIRLAPGPSREVSASFDGAQTLTRSASGTLHLRVRSRVRLQTSSKVARIGGAPLIFWGQVAAPSRATHFDGVSVQLQFRLPGLPWDEFRTVQTDARGRFRYAYRFSDDDSRGARFQFRAYAPAQDGWPYEPGGSRPIVVRGI
jgi:hypothetical protein